MQAPKSPPVARIEQSAQEVSLEVSPVKPIEMSPSKESSKPTSYVIKRGDDLLEKPSVPAKPHHLKTTKPCIEITPPQEENSPIHMTPVVSHDSHVMPSLQEEEPHAGEDVVDGKGLDDMVNGMS